MMMNSIKKIILASQSPRRAKLLEEAGIGFEVIAPHINETPLPNESPKDYVCRVSQEKAESIVVDNKVIIAADTAVVNENKILGKPANENDAKEMLLSLSDKTHVVITGVCIRYPNKTENFFVETKVTFRKISKEEIDSYVATKEPMDKAGAYAIQGGAAKMVRKINGSYSNVVGLPLCEVVEKLEIN